MAARPAPVPRGPEHCEPGGCRFGGRKPDPATRAPNKASRGRPGRSFGSPAAVPDPEPCHRHRLRSAAGRPPKILDYPPPGGSVRRAKLDRFPDSSDASAGGRCAKLSHHRNKLPRAANHRAFGGRRAGLSSPAEPPPRLQLLLGACSDSRTGRSAGILRWPVRRKSGPMRAIAPAFPLAVHRKSGDGPPPATCPLGSWSIFPFHRIGKML